MLPHLFTTRDKPAQDSELLSYLRRPISKESVDFAIRIIGERPATLLYKDFVEMFLRRRPNLPIRRLDAEDFRRSLPGTGLPQAIFRKLRMSPDATLQLRIDYWVDQAVDTCAQLGSTSEMLEPYLIPHFIGFFGLHEQIFWVISGACSFESDQSADIVHINDTAESAAFLRWYSGFLSKSAEEALLLKMLKLAGIEPHELAKQRKLPLRISRDNLESIALLILDSCYSLSPRFSDALEGKIDFRQAKETIKWVSLLILWREARDDDFLNLDDPIVKDLGLSFNEIQKLKSIDTTIVEFGRNETAIRLRIGFFVGYLSSVIREFVTPRLAVGSIGKWFETEYLPKYIGADAIKELYKVYPGFKSKDKDEIKGYDIDLIIEDIRRKKFYFIQVKYQFKNFFPYLSDELEGIYMKKDGIPKGIRQLRSLRGSLQNKVVSQKICTALGRSLDNVSLENDCHFILLHNFNSYEIAEIDGIATYNWNLFRNFLRGGMHATEIRENGSFSRSLRYQDALPLESAILTARKIGAAIDAYAKYSYGFQASWEAYKTINISLAHPFNNQLRTRLCLI